MLRPPNGYRVASAQLRITSIFDAFLAAGRAPHDRPPPRRDRGAGSAFWYSGHLKGFHSVVFAISTRERRSCTSLAVEWQMPDDHAGRHLYMTRAI